MIGRRARTATPAQTKDPSDGFVQRIALRLAAWMERWFPDTFVFALIAVVITGIGAAAIGASPKAIVTAFGGGFWDLITFTLQVSVVAISGHIVATSPPAQRAITWLARIPKNGRQAVAFVALLATSLSLINWAISLIFSALLTKELARRRPDMDYRAAGAASFLGLGGVWAMGLSSAPAQMMANEASMPPSLLPISGVLPFSQTVFLPQSLLLTGVLIVLTVLIAYMSAPNANRALTAQAMHIDLEYEIRKEEPRTPRRPGEWFDTSWILPAIVVTAGAAYLVMVVIDRGWWLALSDLNTYNFLFIMLGLALHGTPRKFLKAAASAIPSVGGVLIQFPFYAGVAAILTQAAAPDGTTLSSTLGHAFSQVASGSLLAPVLAIYSVVLGIFLPSGGGKWIIEAPYVMQAANDAHLHLGWAVQVYNAAEALPNLINPFWMLPVLGLLGLRARHVVGFTFLQFLVHLPVVLIMVWLLSGTLEYIPPVIP
ncbi:TIGR00366 family protein [Agromyces mediolanus]|uniref:short-chain fatty acid transporter n=1 Tax=Agromyces mediolanus TaxID=41986 RepID=UPI002041EAC7|nr:TIGR00366 family protein [Agromyces mediolanus]MCM3658334.1 TIGR00366 family protein [Agromyces mediolanus]